MRNLTKTKLDFFSNKGWSGKKFFPIAKNVIPKLENCSFIIEYGRSVLYIKKHNKLLKAYVHYNGRSSDYLTFVDKDGEVKTFHYDDSHMKVLNLIIEFFQEGVYGEGHSDTQP